MQFPQSQFGKVRRHRKEYPVDPYSLRKGQSQNQPQGVVEALIGLPPHTAIPFTQDEARGLRELLVEAVEDLPPMERFIVDALLFEKKSLRELAITLSIPKTTLARRRDQILGKIRTQIENNPIIQEYLYG